MAYIPKKISHGERVELLKQEVLRLTKLGLNPRHIATKLDIPPHSVYNYKSMLQKEGHDLSVKEQMTRADKIVKTKVLQYYADRTMTIQEDVDLSVEVTDTTVFIPLLPEERKDIQVLFTEEGITVSWCL
jgi:DNA-directed RNA polymerase subunit F